MPVTLTNIALNPKFTDEFTSSGGGGIDYPIGSILDKLTCALQIDIWWNTLNVPMTFDSATKTITRNDLIIFPTVITPQLAYPQMPLPPSLPGYIYSFIKDGFKIGDTITVAGTTFNNGIFHIVAITDRIITVVEALTSEIIDTATVNIYGDTPITAIDFYFNFIENDSPETYKSNVDNLNSNKFNANGLTTGKGSVNMIAVGNSKGWQACTTTIVGNGTANHIQSYTITQIIYITPAFMTSWLSNIQNINNPSGFYQNGESLKYIAKIDAKFNNTEVTPAHTSNIFDNFKRGNIGFYNEFLNGYDANYNLKSITFTDVLTSNSVSNLQYGRETDVEIRLTSVNNKFAAGCKTVLTQLYLPLSESDYINTGAKTMIDNYRWDRLILTEGTASANGSQYGTDYQSIKSAQAILISPSELKIIYRCSLAAVYNTFIDGKDPYNRNYLITATPQDIAVTTTIGTDRNAIICHTSQYTTDKTDSSLFEIIGGDVTFHEYPDEVMNDFTDFKGFSNDYCLVRGNFQIKSLSDVLLQKLTFKIEATKIYNNNIVLEQCDFNVAAFIPCSDFIQKIDISQSTNFKVSVNSIYDEITIQRNPALDSGNYIAYSFTYPFKIRYETWIDLMSAACMNGTQNWAYYQEQGWSIQFNIYATCFDNVNNYENDFLHSCNLSINKFDSIVTKINCIIQTFDSTETETLEGILDDNNDTIIIATFKGDFTSLPANTTGYYGILTIDSPEIGGVNYNQSTSTEEDVLSGGIWKGYTNNRAVLTKVDNNTITIKDIIDFTKINDLSAGRYPLNYLSLYAKLGYINDLGILLDETDIAILQENGDGILL